MVAAPVAVRARRHRPPSDSSLGLEGRPPTRTPDFSAATGTLLFMRDTDGEDQVLSMSLGDTDEPAEPEPLSSSGDLDSPAWSPGGDAFVYLGDESTSVWVASSADDEEQVAVEVPDGTVIGPPAWGTR